MPVVVTSVDVTRVPTTGGILITLTGTFEVGTRHRIHIGPLGNATDPTCHGGVPGQADQILPVSSTTLRGYTPVLPSSIDAGVAMSIHVVQIGTGDTDDLASAVVVEEPTYPTSVFDIRRALPPNYKLGPRTVELLQRLGESKAYPVGFLEAVTSVIGESDADIGGLFQTRTVDLVVPSMSLAATYTWNGTTTILSGDTSFAILNGGIRLDSDGQVFKVVSINPNVSVTIENPNGWIIPTGSSPSSTIPTRIAVESLYGFPSSGAIEVDGIVYHYTSIVNDPIGLDVSLHGLTYFIGGEERVGVFKSHRVGLTVVDVSKVQSAYDLLRRSILVAYAEEDDLGVVGQNLGVGRLPYFSDDDAFRQVIQALAYNPRGTIYGLELALTGLVGAGNFEIAEDLINYPCTVFINVKGAFDTSDSPLGKAYLGATELHPSDSDTQVTTDHAVVARGAVGSVTFADENVYTETRVAFPSAATIEEYPGDPGTTVWSLIGTGVVENTHIKLLSNPDCLQFLNGAPTDEKLYRHLMRIQPESRAEMQVSATFPTGSGNDPSLLYGFRLSDTERHLGVGLKATSAFAFTVGFCNWSTAAFIGSTFTLARSSDFYTFRLIKNERDQVVLEVFDIVARTVMRITEDYASFPAAGGDHKAEFGAFKVSGSGADLRVHDVSAWAHTPTDYWAVRGTTGAVSVVTQLEAVLDAIFILGDVGKILFLRNSGVTNPQGGNNNGRYEVTSVLAGDTVTLDGPLESNATLSSVHPTRVVVPASEHLFQYPDDLGKQIVISGSSNGNDGAYTITQLLQMGTETDLGAGLSPIPEKTNIAVVSGAAFNTEDGLDWRLRPVFVNEANLAWELSDAGSFVGNVLTLRRTLPIITGGYVRILQTTYSVVLSGEALRDSGVENPRTNNSPITFTYNPFYLSDPIGFIRKYLDDITAAGVIPDYEFK